MRPRSLRLNLILWFTLIFSLILALSDYVTYSALQKILLTELDSSLTSMATIESAAFKEGNTLDLETINRLADHYPRFMRQFVQVIDSSGAILNQFGLPENTGSLLDRSQIERALSGEIITFSRSLNGNPLRLAAVGGERDGKSFLLIVGTKTDNERNTAAQIALMLMAIDIVAVAASVVGGYMIIGKALKPVDHIAERAYQIGAGDLHRRLEYFDSSSEMMHLTSVLNEMFDKLERLFESQEQFIQDASHEIRSPLAALRCRLEVALRQDRSAEQYRQVIEGSVQDSARLTDLAEDLFLLARADSDNLRLEFREVSLSELLAAVHEQFIPLAEDHSVDFHIEAQPHCMIYADRPRIHQAFRNIVENALKYTPKNGRVTITVKQEGDYIRADIEDTGIAIPVEEQANIFRRFYRVDHARSRGDGGTGLGLAICDQIIRAHQGRIEIDSVVGRGTRFTVYLASVTALLEGVPA